jgi:hypothetical protein
MAVDEVRVAGLEYLTLATELLQRVRLADPDAGLWEAADLQWWWRTPRRSDQIDQRFFVDDQALGGRRSDPPSVLLIAAQAIAGSRTCVSRNWLPDGSRNAESTPYGRSSGDSVNSTPRAVSSA